MLFKLVMVPEAGSLRQSFCGIIQFQVIVTELIRSKGITLLINSGGQQGTLLHADQNFDITQEVIDAMNEKED